MCPLPTIRSRVFVLFATARQTREIVLSAMCIFYHWNWWAKSTFYAVETKRIVVHIPWRSSAPKRFAMFEWQFRTFGHKKVGKTARQTREIVLSAMCIFYHWNWWAKSTFYAVETKRIVVHIAWRSSAPKRFAMFEWQFRTFGHKKVGKAVAKTRVRQTIVILIYLLMSDVTFYIQILVLPTTSDQTTCACAVTVSRLSTTDPLWPTTWPTTCCLWQLMTAPWTLVPCLNVSSFFKWFKLVKKGFQLVKKGFQLVKKGFQLVKKGFQLVKKWFQLVKKWFQLVKKGFQLVKKWFQLVKKGFQLVKKGFQQVKKGFQLVKKGFQLVKKGFQLVKKWFKLVKKWFKLVEVI